MDERQRAAEHFEDEHVTSLHPNYIGVWWWLLGLTVLELIAGTTQTGPAYPQLAKIMLLVAMALAKAALVALYFMHLKFENRTLSVIAVSPLVLCGFFLFMLFPDAAWRWLTG